MQYKHFICDVDGCLNDGVIYWGQDGKPFKAFGNYDHEGLKFLKGHLNIEFITADKAGWDISHSRIVNHMGFPLTLVSESHRYIFVEQFGFESTVYMGDGFHDAKIIQAAALGIAPLQARQEAREVADFVTASKGGEGAVMDACLHILNKMDIIYGL